MNIAIIESKLDGKGGSQRQALSFALALQKLGHRVIVYTLLYSKEKCFPDMLDQLRVIALEKRIECPKEITFKPLGFLNYFRRSAYESRLAKNLAGMISSDTDILNPHDRLGYRTAAFYKKMVKNVPSVAMMNDILTKSWASWRKSQFDSGLRLSLTQRLLHVLIDFYEVRKFILPHEGMTVLDTRTKKWAKQYFGKEAFVLRSGLDLEKFPYKERRPFAQNKARLILVGAFFLHRRYEDAIRAAKILKDRGFSAELSIAGDYSGNNEYKDYYRRLSLLSKELGIEDRVFFLGKISDEELRRSYQSHDIYISANHLQSWGLAAFEAMACGLPVIISKTAGASEVLTHRENALIVNPNSPEEIALAIEECLKTPEFYLALSKEGRKFVVENISWDMSAKNLLLIFEQFLNRRVKTILIPVSNSFFVRNFLRTDAYGELRRVPDMRLVLLAPQDKIEYYRREFLQENIVFDVLPDLMKMKSERFFAFVEKAGTHSRTVAIMQGTELRRRGTKESTARRVFYYLLGRAFWHLGRFSFYRRLVRFLYLLFPTRVFRRTLAEYKPDLVFSPLMLRGETLLIKEAKSTGIKTLGMVHSWDNLTSKSFLRVHPDHLLVHTPMLKDQAVYIGDYPREKITITGIPQYDGYFLKERVRPRDEFIRELGGDPSKKLLVYAFSGKAGLHIDFDILDILHKAVVSGEIKEQPNVLIRPYPKHDILPEKMEQLKKQYGFLGLSVMSHVGKRTENWEFDEAALDLLSNTLAHADIVINMFSTFFIEAAIFDKPLIAIAFDGYQKFDYWNSARRFFDWDHLADLKPLDGIIFVRSEKELTDVLNGYLKNSKLHAQGREAIVRQQCQFDDGKSGERVAQAILRML